MEYGQFMRAMMNAPFDKNKCAECGGTGLKEQRCCNGYECGCRGMPIDFIECGCDCEIISDDALAELAKEKICQSTQ